MSGTESSLLAKVLSDRLGITDVWQTFSLLWNRKPDSLRRAFYKALGLTTIEFVTDEEDWIAASTSDIFKMQTTRKITEINGVKCYFDKDNYAELDVSKFDKEAERE